MPDADTLSVIRDVICIALLAAFVGATAYGMLRRSIPEMAWDNGGQVVVRQYGWRDGMVALLLTLYLCGSILAAPASSPAKAAAKLSEAEQFGAVAQTLLADFMMVALVVGFLSVLREFDPAVLFGLRKLSIKQAFMKALRWIVPAFLVVWAVSVLSSVLLDGTWPDMGPQSAVQILETTKNPLVKVTMLLTAALVAPLAEEVLFRGFIFGVLKRYTDSYFAALVSAILFGAIHMHVGYFLPLFALGLIFAAAYEHTGCLLVSIFMHALFNSAQEVFMLFDGK